MTVNSPPYPIDFDIKGDYVEIQDYKIHYLAHGEGNVNFLMIHGNPTSAYLYRNIMKGLAKTGRSYAIDLLGFGASDKPKEIDKYTLSKHIEIVEKFIEILNLDKIILVGQDWGGPIGFGTLVRNQKRFIGIVAMNTMTTPVVKVPLLFKFAFTGPLANKLLFNGYFQEVAFKKGTIRKIPEKDLKVYLDANNEKEKRAGIAAFPKMIPTSKNHPNHPLFLQIYSKVESIDIPSLIMFSDKDVIFNQQNGEDFAKRMARGKFVGVPNAGHFLQEDNPQFIVSEIRKFVEGLSVS